MLSADMGNDAMGVAGPAQRMNDDLMDHSLSGVAHKVTKSSPSNAQHVLLFATVLLGFCRSQGC
jgi:hypothetical protein